MSVYRLHADISKHDWHRILIVSTMKMGIFKSFAATHFVL